MNIFIITILFFTLFLFTATSKIFLSLTSEPRPAVSRNRRNRKWFSEASEWEHLSALWYWFARSDGPKETSHTDCERGLEGRCETQWLRIGFYISPLIQYSLLSPCFKQTSVTCGPLGASQGGCAYEVFVQMKCACVRAHTSKDFWSVAAICWCASARRKVGDGRSEGGKEEGASVGAC